MYTVPRMIIAKKVPSYVKPVPLKKRRAAIGPSGLSASSSKSLNGSGGADMTIRKHDAISLEPRSALRHEPQRRRIEGMLFDEHAVRQRLLRVARQHRHLRLRDGWAGIEIGRREMHRASVLFDPGCERLRVRLQAGKVREQRGVDVEHPPLPFGHEAWREDAHEAREADELDCVRCKLSINLALEGLAILAERAVVDDGRRHDGRHRARQAWRVGPVGKNKRNLGW